MKYMIMPMLNPMQATTLAATNLVFSDASFLIIRKNAIGHFNQSAFCRKAMHKSQKVLSSCCENCANMVALYLDVVNFKILPASEAVTRTTREIFLPSGVSPFPRKINWNLSPGREETDGFAPRTSGNCR
jgi:hypothetical protein